LLEDSRKLRRRRKDAYVLIHMDEFVDELLSKDRSCATSLWKLPGRQQLEDLDLLEERISPLQAELDAMDEDDNGDAVMEDEDRNGRASSDERSPDNRSEDSG